MTLYTGRVFNPEIISLINEIDNETVNSIPEYYSEEQSSRMLFVAHSTLYVVLSTVALFLLIYFFRRCRSRRERDNPPLLDLGKVYELPPDYEPLPPAYDHLPSAPPM